jgi:hypothetical protein
LLERAAIVVTLALAIGALWGGFSCWWMIGQGNRMTTNRGAAAWSIVSGLQLGAFSSFFMAGIVSAEVTRNIVLGLVSLIVGMGLGAVAFRLIGRILTLRIMHWLGV